MRGAAARHKARMAALQQELREATARLAAFNPRQSERLLLEVGRLRETVASLHPYKVFPRKLLSPQAVDNLTKAFKCPIAAYSAHRDFYPRSLLAFTLLVGLYRRKRF